MADKTPQYTIKVGADSVDYFSREVTKSDIAAGLYDSDEEKIGLIQGDSVESSSDVFSYPQLIRRTGDSFKGTQESIESNELRKGRTKSAPRKGNESSEGSLDFELSPETYDDILEATLRGKWLPWTSDTESPTNIKEAGQASKETFADGTFLSKVTDPSSGEISSAQRRLWVTSAELETIKANIKTAHPTWKESEYFNDPSYPVVVSDAALEVSEVTCGTNDVKYSILKHFDGVEGDDLFQEHEHMAVGSMSLSVSPGQIVTGSFSFAGARSSDLAQRGVTTDGVIESEEHASYEDGDTPKGIVKILSAWKNHASRFATSKNPADVKTWLDNLPEKGTSTDQYTAREGFLYVNGVRVRYGSSLEFSLDNGLNKTYAIFEKGAIATSPLTLDITGTLGVYLIKGYSEKLYNLATQDKDVEVLFCFQDKEDDPESFYVVQIFKTKFTDKDLSTGAEELEVSFPFQSFEERAVRIFRLRKKTFTIGLSGDSSAVTLTSADTTATLSTSDVSIKVSVNGADAAVNLSAADNTVTATINDAPSSGDTISVKAVYGGRIVNKTYTAA